MLGKFGRSPRLAILSWLNGKKSKKNIADRYRRLPYREGLSNDDVEF
jgi:hypothetical protein